MSYDAKDLIRVLTACRKTGVTELKIGDIQVKFGAGEADRIEKEKTEVFTLTDGEFQEAEKEVNINENVVEAEDRLELLQIDDPALYERLVIERELEDRDNSAEITLN